MQNEKMISLLGFPIANLTQEMILNNWHDFQFIITVNVDILMKLYRNKEFATAVRQASDSVTLVNDSQVLKLATRLILGKRFVSKVSGSDLLPAFGGVNGPSDAKIFFMGGVDDTAIRAMERFNERTRGAVVVGACSPSYGFDVKPQESASLVDAVNASGANVLAIGVGAPKQELWMLRHAEEMPHVKLFIGVGATLDFIAGNIKRAPSWISSAGFEWLYRLFLEPKRLARRYLIDGPPVFLLLLKQRIGM